MSFDCMHFACFSCFCVHTAKDIRRNWTKASFASLHSDEQTRKPVCLKNGGINVIMFKKKNLFRSISMSAYSVADLENFGGGEF